MRKSISDWIEKAAYFQRRTGVLGKEFLHVLAPIKSTAARFWGQFLYGYKIVRKRLDGD